MRISVQGQEYQTIVAEEVGQHDDDRIFRYCISSPFVIRYALLYASNCQSWPIPVAPRVLSDQ